MPGEWAPESRGAARSPDTWSSSTTATLRGRTLPRLPRRASDDHEAKTRVIAALDGSGLRAFDADALTNSRVLEAMAAFGSELGDRDGLGQSFGFKYLPAPSLTVPRA